MWKIHWNRFQEREERKLYKVDRRYKQCQKISSIIQRQSSISQTFPKIYRVSPVTKNISEHDWCSSPILGLPSSNYLQKLLKKCVTLCWRMVYHFIVVETEGCLSRRSEVGEVSLPDPQYIINLSIPPPAVLSSCIFGIIG